MTDHSTDSFFKKPTNSILHFYQNIVTYQLRFHPIEVSLLFMGIIIGIIYECLIPIIFKWLFNDVLVNKNIELLSLVAILLILAFVCLIVSSILQTITTSKLGVLLVSNLRYQMYKKVQDVQLQDRHQYHEDELLSIFNNDIPQIENIAINVMWVAFRLLFMCIVGGTLLVYFDWHMSVMVAFIIPFSLLLPRFFSKSTSRLLQLKNQLGNNLLSKIHEAIDRQQVIRLFLLKHLKQEKFKSILNKAQSISYRYNTSAMFTSRTSYLGINFTQLIVLFVGAYLVITHRTAAGTLIGFIMLLGTVNSSITALTSLYPLLNRGADSLNRVQKLLLEKIPRFYTGKQIMPQMTQGIHFKNIQCGYGDRLILSGVDFSIKKGQFIAVVGLSGSGKTTLLKTLLQELPLRAGSIWFDDVNLKDILTDSLLSQVRVVLQQPLLFNGTITENIQMGKLDATVDEIIEAAKKAEIHNDILSLPDQYQTLIGKGGIELSGGQCQRITIARTLISKPAILCLDEPSSALDPISGAAIDEVIANMIGSCTILMITHRLSSVVKADNIFVIDKGILAESGKHTELIAKQGLYCKLWQKQQGFILSSDMKQASVIPKWLKHVPLFESLEDSILDEIAKEFVMEHVKSEEVIFKQGDHGDKFYILMAGVVEVIKEEASSTSTIAKLTDGDFFGEIALMFDKPRTATIKTKTACIFLTLHFQQFHKIYQTLPKTTQELLQMKAKERT